MPATPLSMSIAAGVRASTAAAAPLYDEQQKPRGAHFAGADAELVAKAAQASHRTPIDTIPIMMSVPTMPTLRRTVVLCTNAMATAAQQQAFSIEREKSQKGSQPFTFRRAKRGG